MRTSLSIERLGPMFLSGFLWLVVAVPADQPTGGAEDLEALLDRLEARAAKVTSLLMHTKRIKRSPAEDHTARSKTWLLREGDMVLMRTESRARVTEKWMTPHQRALTTELTVVDGTYRWHQLEVYDEIRVSKQKVSPQRPLAALREACRHGRPRLLPSEELLGQKCVVLEIQSGEGDTARRTTYWIAEAHGTVLKTVQVEPDGGRTELAATSIRLDEAMDRSLFRYQPPEGVRVQDLDAIRAKFLDRASEAATQPANE